MNFLTGLLVAIVVVAVIAGGSLLWVTTSITRETVSDIAVRNPDGASGRALIVYQPGLTDFPQRTVEAFATGLAERGWRVEQTTASRKAPAAVAGYDLVVIGSPIYAGALAKPVADYLQRVGDLGGKPVAVVLAGAGETPAALADAAAAVGGANGRLVASYAYTSMRPNEASQAYTGSNVDVAYAMAHDAGLALDVAAVH